MTPNGALEWLSTSSVLAEDLVHRVMLKVAPLMRHTDELEAVGSFSVVIGGDERDVIAITVDAPDVDAAESLLDHMKARVVAFAVRDDHIVGEVDGEEYLKILVRPDGILYLEINSRAVIVM